MTRKDQLERRHSPLEPREISSELSEIRSLVPRLVKLYSQAWELGYVSERITYGDELKVSTGPGDPTGSVVASKAAVRGEVAAVAKNLKDAVSLMRSSKDSLTKLIRHPKEEVLPDRMVKPSIFPHELASYRQAQKRREGRGE